MLRKMAKMTLVSALLLLIYSFCVETYVGGVDNNYDDDD